MISEDIVDNIETNFALNLSSASVTRLRLGGIAVNKRLNCSSFHIYHITLAILPQSYINIRFERLKLIKCETPNIEIFMQDLSLCME